MVLGSKKQKQQENRKEAGPNIPPTTQQFIDLLVLNSHIMIFHLLITMCKALWAECARKYMFLNMFEIN